MFYFWEYGRKSPGINFQVEGTMWEPRAVSLLTNLEAFKMTTMKLADDVWYQSSKPTKHVQLKSLNPFWLNRNARRGGNE